MVKQVYNSVERQLAAARGVQGIILGGQETEMVA